MAKKIIQAQRPSRKIFLTQGILLLFWSVLIALSLFSYTDGAAKENWLGLLGYFIGWALHYLFGLSSIFFPFFLWWIGVRKVCNKPIPHPKPKLFFFILLILSLSILLCQIAETFPGFAAQFKTRVYSSYFPPLETRESSVLRHYLGGVPLHHFYRDTKINLHHYLGGVGTFFIFSALFFLSAALLLNLSLTPFMAACGKLLQRPFQRRPAAKKPDAPFKPAEKVRSRPFASEQTQEHNPPSCSLPDREPNKETQIHFAKVPLPPASLEKKDEKTLGFALPSLSLLTQVEAIDQTELQSDLRRQAEILEETLRSFGIEAKVGAIHCGPTITSFEVHPAVGVKVQKIKTLENDIALNMQAKSIRIIAPIPGKAAVGIEVPNAHPQEVSFRELMEDYQSQPRKLHIPLLLGKAVNGDPIWADLTRMPHLIIAGATGSGKSVCINTIVMSILLNARPDEIKLVMIDPKKVELTAYSRLPHMIAPVITEPGGACAALRWLVKEMERRYEILRQLGIRNIHGFNTRKMNADLENSLDIDIPEHLPYIVVIVDELADLMMVSSSDIETPIARIAQMARAIGIHLILATQRPSREVITGLIKANFPTRIAFKVSSRVNSQIIIDENGAEALLGNGDMLFMPPGSSSLVRAQGAFIRDEDINKVIQNICSQSPTNYLIPSFDLYREASELQGDFESRDSFFDEAKSLILETGNASTTFLQRKLKIGYARAASLMDQLEAGGIIGPQEGAKPRKIFYPARKMENEGQADDPEENEED